MARVQTRYDGGGERTQAVPIPTIEAVRQRFDPKGTGAFELAKALGTTGDYLIKFNAENEQRKAQEQEGKLAWYVEQFRQDHKGGAVSEAQVKNRFPETVPVIAARVAEAVGRKDAEAQTEGLVQEVMQNDTIRLDSAARAAFIQKKRQELIAAIPQGNDFYGAGFVASVDRKLAEYDNKWAGETAQYHQQVQAQSYSDEVRTILNGGKGSLEELDMRYKQSSSLNNIERNKLTIETATEVAFASDDPSILDKVPTRFLSAESQAKIAQTKIQIQNQRMSNFRNRQALQEYERSEDLRRGKMEMVDALVKGDPINPAKYREHPEKFAFAMQMKDAGTIPETTSTANAQIVRNKILTGSSVGPSGSQEEYIDAILSKQGLNPKEKQALINEVPKLLEGVLLMKDDAVQSALNLRLNARLQSLESSTNSAIQSLITGRNLRGEVMSSFQAGVRHSFDAEYQETGKWPVGRRKLELIEAETQKAEKLLEGLTKIGGSIAPQTSSGASPGTPKSPSGSSSGGAPTTATHNRVPVEGLPGVYKWVPK